MSNKLCQIIFDSICEGKKNQFPILLYAISFALLEFPPSFAGLDRSSLIIAPGAPICLSHPCLPPTLVSPQTAVREVRVHTALPPRPERHVCLTVPRHHSHPRTPCAPHHIFYVLSVFIWSFSPQKKTIETALTAHLWISVSISDMGFLFLY